MNMKKTTTITTALVMLSITAIIAQAPPATAPAPPKTLAATMSIYVFPTTGQDAAQQSKDERRQVLFDKLMPEDLLKYGLIPEFVGRLPVVVSLAALAQEDLVKVLTEPKNAVTRQFTKFLSLDKVELVFTPDALEATAKLAIDRKTGARALRTIVEEALLDVMYDIPERTDVTKVVITAETIEHGQPPMLVTETEDGEPRRRGRRAAREEPEEESA